MGTYNSLFDHYTKQTHWLLGYQEGGSRALIETQFINHSLEYVVKQLNEAVKSKDTPERTAKLIWRPQQIVRGAVNYKIIYPRKRNAVESVQMALDLAKEVYLQGPDANANDIEEKTAEFLGKFPELKEWAVTQDVDITTCTAAHPGYSNHSAEAISGKLGGNCLLLCIANGGIAPGIDLYHRVRALNENADTRIYTARLSKDKQGDTKPMLLKRELEKIRTHLEEVDNLVIFDEDTFTGGTLKRAAKFFRKEIDSDIYVQSNLRAHSYGNLSSVPDKWGDFWIDVVHADIEWDN